MLKRVDTAVFEAVKEFEDGRQDGATGSYGLEDGRRRYSTRGGFVDDIKAQLEDVKAKIIGGEIKVSETA